MASTRYDITLECESLIIEPFPGQKLVASGRVHAVGLASETKVLKVRRCRFTGSNPVLKAPMVSALETVIS